ncbi:MAG: NAD-dependent protein deacetylase [Planctomycetota bacterium]|nr:NAD-dependent protein deacetylase [Planctomycetota bacterium]
MGATQPRLPPDAELRTAVRALAAFVGAAKRLFVLTGAGCSTGSGIPDYRDDDGQWKRQEPLRHGEFVRSESARRRYWARSMIGWPRMAAARPNDAHVGLARLEAQQRVSLLVTQNVDGLHQAAGSREVLDLHGRIADVACLDCEAPTSRATYQERLELANPGWLGRVAPSAPDGDADLEINTDQFVVPPCSACGGMLKPDVVFFGASVPPGRVASAYDALASSDAMLVVGSSLMVFSGLRFVRAAARAGLPIAILNRGRTRADEVATLKLAAPCGAVLTGMLAAASVTSTP